MVVFPSDTRITKVRFLPPVPIWTVSLMVELRFRTPVMKVRFLHGPPYAGVAQLVGHLICTQAVVGSIPITSSNAPVAQWKRH